jgi:hypothetical protein
MADSPKSGVLRDVFVLFAGAGALGVVAGLYKMPMWISMSMIWIWVLGFPRSRSKPRPDDDHDAPSV